MMKVSGDNRPGINNSSTWPEEDSALADLIGRLVQLKGVASMLLVILLITRRPFTKREIQTFTGISPSAIRRALLKMQEVGAVIQPAVHQWQISDQWFSQFAGLIFTQGMSKTDSAGSRLKSAVTPGSEPFVPSGKPSVPSGKPWAFAKAPFVPSREHFVPSVEPFIPSGEHFIPSGEHFVPSGKPWAFAKAPFVPSREHFVPSVEHFVPSESVVVVDNLNKEKDKDIQQQQQTVISREKLTVALNPINGAQLLSGRSPSVRPDRPATPAGKPLAKACALSKAPYPPSIQICAHLDGSPAQTVDRFTPGDEAGEPRGEQGTNVTTVANQTVDGQEQKAALAGYLKQAGILGQAFEDFMHKQALLGDPAPVLAWWWYANTQQSVRNPAALAIRYLYGGEEVPENFLALVRLWARVSGEHRLEIEEDVQRNWGAERLTRKWVEHYKESTAKAFIALKELYLADPALLEL